MPDGTGPDQKVMGGRALKIFRLPSRTESRG
jgi:hypothetical protein